jgi:hypothetical protein
VHADKEPEPLNLGVPVVNFPRANVILTRAQALLWVRDCTYSTGYINFSSEFLLLSKFLQLSFFLPWGNIFWELKTKNFLVPWSDTFSTLNQEKLRKMQL